MRRANDASADRAGLDAANSAAGLLHQAGVRASSIEITENLPADERVFRIDVPVPLESPRNLLTAM